MGEDDGLVLNWIVYGKESGIFKRGYRNFKCKGSIFDV